MTMLVFATGLRGLFLQKKESNVTPHGEFQDSNSGLEPSKQLFILKFLSSSPQKPHDKVKSIQQNKFHITFPQPSFPFNSNFNLNTLPFLSVLQKSMLIKSCEYPSSAPLTGYTTMINDFSLCSQLDSETQRAREHRGEFINYYYNFGIASLPRWHCRVSGAAACGR